MVQGLQAELKAVEEIDERDDYLRNTGIKVLRFTSEDIDNRIEWVIEQIKSFSPLGETGKGVE
jgi:very-short-patch-repair endonuclease